jgi:hypothetical protein
VQSSTPGATVATIQTNINVIPHQVTSPAVSVTCNWTEHTSLKVLNTTTIAFLVRVR